MAPVATAVGPFVATGHSIIKDLFLYIKNKAKFVDDLETNLSKLTLEVARIHSRKETIDRDLETDGSIEQTEEYAAVAQKIEHFLNIYERFVSDYNKYCSLPAIPKHDPVRSATNILNDLDEREGKTTILTRHFFTLSKLSKNITKLLDHVSQVTVQINKENMTRKKKCEPVLVKHSDDVELPSLDEYAEKVLSLCERKNRIAIVGLYGVGKTAVMRYLNNKLASVNDLGFDYVILIKYPAEMVSSDDVVKTLQKDIMERLKLVKQNSVDRNANAISEFLGHKKYMLLMDDVSSCIDLGHLGIIKDHANGKVVIASNDDKVIKRMTDSYQEVMVERLSDDDAFNFFLNIIGRQISDTSILNIAHGIIKSCGGFPGVIKAVATYLRNKKEDAHLWNNAKAMLQSETTDECLGFAGPGNAFKFAYNQLGDDQRKKCLLYGALFPNNHRIYKDYLIECWMSEEFMVINYDHTQKLRVSRDHGAAILTDLLDKFLLENCSEKHVKMPVLFRKVALAQNYPDDINRNVYVSEKGKAVKDENWRDANWISINHPLKLPQCPESHNLRTLLLQSKPDPETMADSFFKNMPELRVLDLHQATISSLPSSFIDLGKLRSLYLNGCYRLSSLPSQVRCLNDLELLDIRGTKIPWLPKEIMNMKLRCLRATLLLERSKPIKKGGKEIEEVGKSSKGIIESLENLEELIIETDLSPGWEIVAKEIAPELDKLEFLTTLHFNFPSLAYLEDFVSKSKSWNNIGTDWGPNTFRSFKFFVGSKETRHPYRSDIIGILAERQLRCSANKDVHFIQKVLEQASAFELMGNDELTSFSDLVLQNLGALEVCIIEACKGVTSIVDNSEESANVILQTLKTLHLFDLPSLEDVWRGSATPGSLSNLTVLSLYGCQKIEVVLNFTLAKTLSSLKELKVENCSQIMTIIEMPGDGGDVILETLENLHISHLPSLQCVLTGSAPPGSLSNSTVPTSSDCPQSEEVIKPAVDRALPSLKQLKVENCENIVKIIGTERQSDIMHQVELVKLINLPQLQRIIEGTDISWDSLKEVVIKRCYNLRNFGLTLNNVKRLQKIMCEESWLTAQEFSDESLRQKLRCRCEFIAIDH